MCSKCEPAIHNSKTTLEGFLQSRPLVYNSKITLKSLDLAPLMTSLQQL